MTRSSDRSRLPARHRGRARALAFALLAATVFGGATAARAGEREDRAEAQRLYAEARRLRAAGDAEGALDRFRRAHALAPTPVTRLELARELEARSRLVEAQLLAESVAALPVTPTETAKSAVARRDAAVFAAELDRRIPRIVLVLQTPREGLEILVDGQPLDPSRWREPLRVDPGAHSIMARREGRVADLSLTLAESEQRELSLSVPEPEPEPPPPLETAPTAPPPAPVAVAPRPPSTAPPAPSEGRDFGPAVPLAFTLAGLGLVGGAVTGSIALSQVSSLEERCPNQRCGAEEHALLSSHQALTTVSTVSFVVGAVAGTAGIVLWALEDDAPPSSGGHAATHSARSAPLGVRWAGTGLALEGTW